MEDPDLLAIWRTMLAGRIERVRDQLDRLENTLAGIGALCEAEAAAVAAWAERARLPDACACNQRIVEAWAAKATLPKSAPRPGRRPGRPKGSVDRYPRLPRGTLLRTRPNGHDGP